MASFTNRDKLRKKFKEIPAAVRQAARLQMAVNAKQLRDQAKAFVPEDSGFLKESIIAQNVSDLTRVEWRVRVKGLYGRWVEFGTKASEAQAPSRNRNYRRSVVMTKGKAAHNATPAQPFFWPAYRLLKRRFKARMRRAAKKAIQGVAK